MYKRMKAAGLSVVVSLGLAVPASAQATRTWVSGVGDDANPCSRTAPCKTLAGAIVKTSPGGEIDVLDPAGIGMLTITKAVTIDGRGYGSTLASGANGIVVAAGSADVVSIINMSIDGLGGPESGLTGIKFISGAQLHVEHSLIFGFENGIVMTTPSDLTVADTTVRDCVGTTSSAIALTGGGGHASLDHVALHNCSTALEVTDGVSATISNSDLSQNTNGVNANATSHSCSVEMESCVVNYCQTAIQSNQPKGTPPTEVDISNVTVEGNNVGFKTSGVGKIYSFGNNQVRLNKTNGSLSGKITPEVSDRQPPGGPTD